jgi:predicted enzyme related to lactoylglutathione lyase
MKEETIMPTLRHTYPAGVPCWADIDAPDPGGAERFYGGLFGWEFEQRADGYRVARLDGADVAGIGSLASGGPVAWNTNIRVENAAATAATVAGNGGTVVAEPQEITGIARVAVCADPAGAVFRVFEPAGLAGAQLVNAPGTWNFNELNTADFEGATSFYGAVFGWETEPLEFMGQRFTMWRQPGYGDFLESIDPGVRQRHQEGGAPPGFTDAVAWMQPLAGEGQPHWSVTFAVADTEAIVAQAERLGGTVVVAPFDAGASIIAQLRDPQGGQFTASQFLG